MAMFRDHYEKGNRDGWTFAYTGAELSKALVPRLNYHTERADYWEDEMKSTEDKIRTSGISIEEYGVTGGSRFEAKIDTALGARLTEAREAFKVHRKLVEEYLALDSEFYREPQRRYELKLGDLRFFGLIGEAQADTDDR